MGAREARILASVGGCNRSLGNVSIHRFQNIVHEIFSKDTIVSTRIETRTIATVHFSGPRLSMAENA
jgi:hypothetical protein